jgi:hypothetical protein
VKAGGKNQTSRRSGSLLACLLIRRRATQQYASLFHEPRFLLTWWSCQRCLRKPTIAQLRERMAEVISLIMEDIEEEHARNPKKIVEVVV